MWARSEIAGVPPIARPLYGEFTGRVISIEDQPATERYRYLIAMREPGSNRAIKVRLNVAYSDGGDGAGPTSVAPGSLVRFTARLMPPAPPMLPGAYNFARTAWFSGLAASGTSLGMVQVIEAGAGESLLSRVRRRLSGHVRRQLPGPEGGIAAALAAGDRGGIAESDAQAMRDSGLAHLLAISGLHVSAIIGLIYFATIRILALFPALALRFRLPVVAAASAALAGIGYTMLTGAQVPTVRSCAAALLVLVALALGRAPLSVRMVGVAAFVVLLIWPETVMGPSFQMSFAAVLAIVGLSSSSSLRRFLGVREEPWPQRALRWLAMLMLSGLVIESVLMPIALFHFHRAGILGAFANMIAIPLTTFAIMPGIILALALDLIGAGEVVWWAVGKAIALILAVAQHVSAQPGAVTLLPAMDAPVYGLFIAGGLWLSLWSGRIRLFGLIPAVMGSFLLAIEKPPDLLIAGDGRNVGIVEPSAGGERLLLLRDSQSDYVRENLLELAGLRGDAVYLPETTGARCNADFCTVHLRREARDWLLLLSRSHDTVPERALAAACDRVDIAISDRWLPRSCQPRWIKADRGLLERTGGLSIDLTSGRIRSVAQGQGQHGWWRSGQAWQDAETDIPPMPQAPQAPQP